MLESIFGRKNPDASKGVSGNKLPTEANLPKFKDLPEANGDDLYNEIAAAADTAYNEGRVAVNAARYEEQALGRKSNDEAA